MTPIIYNWTGEALVPATPFMARLCDRELVVGEQYRMVEEEERSAKSHRFYFACIREAWLNLPDSWSDRITSPEHLRKYALVKAGFCDSQTLVAGSKAEAQRIAAFMRPIDEFAVITVEGSTVTRYVAKSQSVKAMTKPVFEESKTAVLEIVSAIIGTDVATLSKSEAA